MDLESFLADISKAEYHWYVKRLSGNDTLANDSHQAGPHVSLKFVFSLFPEWENRTDQNQATLLDLTIDSHGVSREIRLVWYNNKFRNRTRNEARFTNFGGKESPVLDPDSTGAIVVFACRRLTGKEKAECHLWVTRTNDEQLHIESLVGTVEPGGGFLWRPAGIDANISNRKPESNCWLSKEEIPVEWFDVFPTGLELHELAVKKVPRGAMDADARLVSRRSCEEQAFYSVEEAVELDHVLAGFNDIDGFLNKARSMIQRRMSRSGRSLELHARRIFEEEGLKPDVGYSWQPKTEMGKKPDFIFPSINSYEDKTFSPERLRMLAVKTSCKDRWRQVINEANRIPIKHLLTLQEGVSINQFKEMQDEGVRLVVPSKNKQKFNKDLRSELITLSEFISEVRQL